MCSNSNNNPGIKANENGGAVFLREKTKGFIKMVWENKKLLPDIDYLNITIFFINSRD